MRVLHLSPRLVLYPNPSTPSPNPMHPDLPAVNSRDCGAGMIPLPRAPQVVVKAVF